MTDDSKATPRPWRTAEEAALDYRPSIIVTADGKSRIAFMYGGGPIRAISKAEERSNAALIVTAVNAHDALVAERDALKKLVYVPGMWRCAKCDFTLLQSNLNAVDGTVSARDEPGDKCPNCSSPLWRVTERQAGNDMADRCEKEIVRANKVVAERDRLRRALEEARDAIEETIRRLDTFEAGFRPAHYSHFELGGALARIREALGDD